MGSTRDKVKRAVRKTVKWGGLVVTVLLVVVWIGSGWWAPFCYPLSWVTITVHNGAANVYYCRYIGSSLLETRRGILASGPEWRWWVFCNANSSQGFVVAPLWLPTSLALLATAAAWRADAKYLRRARVGLCAACGYDRAGLAAGSLCPECGMQPEAR